ncbi:MAG: accessory gene regulator B family protein, partial [Clostridiales bacterium]|nr:accessory gene regulator B family protein [Clostridiales bacterium]
MDVLVAKIIGNFVKKGIVKETDASIYAFGLRQGMTITINILTIFVVGIILGELLNLIVFS